jgi:hypothetical protein
MPTMHRAGGGLYDDHLLAPLFQHLHGPPGTAAITATAWGAGAQYRQPAR